MTPPPDDFNLPLPEPVLDHLADLVAGKLAEKLPKPPTPYLNSEQAARYIGFEGERAAAKMSELVRSGKIPCGRDGTRLVFRRADLDAYLCPPPDRFRG